jgi:hypothetical protein
MICLDPIILAYTPDQQTAGGIVTLDASVRFVLGERVLTVAEGFWFDGASIPKQAWGLIGHPYLSEYIAAALAHDALYHSHLLPKAEADAIFRRLLKAAGVSWFKRDVMTRAVQVFGGLAYRNADVTRWGKYVSLTTEAEHLTRRLEVA